jgi:hypothetical protein
MGWASNVRMKPVFATVAAILCAGATTLLAATVKSGQEFDQAVQDSARRAMVVYPDCMTPGTALFRSVDDERLRLERSDPAFFKNPEWPMILTTEQARRLGIEPASASPQTVTPPRAVSNAPTLVVPSTSNSGAFFPSRGTARAPETAGSVRPAPPQPIEGLIGLPQLAAKTSSNRRHIGISQSGFTRTEQDTRTMSVDVTCRFFEVPQIPYEVQCFFVARDEASRQRSIFDAVVGQSQETNVAWRFESQPLAGGTRRFTSVPFTSTIQRPDGSVETHYGTDDSQTTTTGNRIEGWIVRVVARGHVLGVQSNQPSLMEMASRFGGQLDAAATRAGRY